MMFFDLITQSWPWWFAGAMIGLFLPFFYFVANFPLGVSTGYGNFCKIVVPHTKLEALNTRSYQKIFTWRVFFIFGIILGAAAARIFSGDYSLITDMGRFNSIITDSLPLSASWFIAGGVFLGFGARVASGCPSAHMINGLPNLASSGIVATVSFFGAAVLVANIVYRIIFSG
jgi:uncharacterized membrane protein YedE/YeeE